VRPMNGICCHASPQGRSRLYSATASGKTVSVGAKAFRVDQKSVRRGRITLKIFIARGITKPLQRRCGFPEACELTRCHERPVGVGNWLCLPPDAGSKRPAMMVPGKRPTVGASSYRPAPGAWAG